MQHLVFSKDSQSRLQTTKVLAVWGSKGGSCLVQLGGIGCRAVQHLLWRMACCSTRPSCQSSTLLSRRTPTSQRLCQTRQSCCLSQVSGQLTQWLIINDSHISQMADLTCCRFCWHQSCCIAQPAHQTKPANAQVKRMQHCLDSIAALSSSNCSVTSELHSSFTDC